MEKEITPVLEDVYPLHALDDIKPNRTFVSWVMRFNDVLDANLLNNALSRLLEIGDWRKLGGRLKFTVMTPHKSPDIGNYLTLIRKMGSCKSTRGRQTGSRMYILPTIHTT